MTADLTCEVYVDGNRLADTADQYQASTPTALSGLDVTWGRSTVVDQPESSSCTFTVADIGGDADFLTVLHVGHVVDVYAAGAIGSGTTPIDVTLDGSFETSTPGNRVNVTGGTAASDTGTVAVDTHAIRVNPSGAGPVTVQIPPGPFSSSLTAWNPIPQVAAGQAWRVTLQVQLGAGCTATIAPAVYASPTSRTPTSTGPTQPVPTGGVYATSTVNYTIPAGTAGWLGVVLVITPAGQWTQAAGTWAAQTLTWARYGGTWIDDLHLLAPPQAAQRVQVFSGRITDLSATRDPAGVVHVAVTAADRYADLGNDYIGDNPWLVETVATRVKRIVTLAATPFAVDVAAWPGGRQVTWVDIDSRAVADLLAELATSTDAVLWPVFAANRGFYLWMEDAAQRQAMAVLAVDGGSGLVVIVGNPRPSAGVVITACDLLADLDWVQDVSDVLSIVDLTWLAQLTDDQGQPDPTETHVILTDQTAIDEYGLRRGGYSTQLVSSTDANTVAQRILNRSRALGWKVSGATWDTTIPAGFDDTHRATALTILDGVRRVGLPITLTDLPNWTPEGDVVGTYLEGGEYTYENGRWNLALTLSPAGLTGQSIKWNEIDRSYRWNQFDPSIAWWNLYGVGKAAA